MAETVKKSRIVSEDDLEESLMQEFNMRLKTCMSSDKLNDDDDTENAVEKEPVEAVYENVEIIRTNGRAEYNPLVQDDSQETENHPLSPRNKLNSVEEFIQIERECLRLEQNGHNHADEDVDEHDVEKTEVVQPQENDECLGAEVVSELEVTDLDQVDEVETIQGDLDKQVLPISPKAEETHSEFETQIIETLEMSEPTNETKSVKDRMFLSTDSASCLLFTQTVTSPMLTPSDERIDFIKGFQTRDSAQNTISDDSNESPKSDPIDETAPSDDYDPEPEVDAQPEIVEEPQQSDITSVDLLKNVPENGHDYEETEVVSTKPEVVEMKARANPKQKYIESISKESSPPPTKPTECKIPSIKSLKEQYITTATSDSPKTPPSLEKSEISSLKSLDIMKQINKFEQISPGKEDTNTQDANASTETTETTYVETTTVETMRNASGQEKSLKKKKSKKSRNHEKENISVSDCDARQEGRPEEGFYNVNVKSLCRSFGDLTKIGVDKGRSNKNAIDSVKTRTKSMSDIRMVGSSRLIENVFKGVSVKALRDKFNSSSTNSRRTDRNINLSENPTLTKSSFSKFDALQKKNVLHVRSTDSSKAQEKFNGNQIDNTNCKSCGKIVFQMEQMKAEKCIWHKNCFRCTECNKQLTVDTYQSHEGTLYCKPHFKALFAPKVVEDDTPQKPRKHEMIIRENQPAELSPDVVRASDKPDLGLEELQMLNMKERFQVFEHHDEDSNHLERTSSTVNVKRSPSILSKLARFQAKGMDIGVADESLNGIPIEESSSDEEEEQEELDGEDADLIRAKRAQREKPFHFIGMSDVKSKWEQGGEQNGRDERREERKQEIQSIRNRLFLGKQGKMKEAYQQAVMDSETGQNVKKTETIEVTDTRSLKERFEKGPVPDDQRERQDAEDMSMFETGITKKSRSIFLELDANASKAPQLSPASPVKTAEVRKAREVFLAKQQSEEVVKSTEAVEDVTVQTADIQQRFKFFETYREPEAKKKQFRITPPREGQVKVGSPEREVYRDPDVVRSEEFVEDSVVAKQTQTAKKMLNKFRQMEEDLSKDQVPLGPKPLKRFTPPPEPVRSETESDEEVSESDEESDEEDGIESRIQDDDLLEAQKAARAKQLRAKFEKWEANELKREQNQSSVNIAEEFGEEQSQIESTKSLRARFESMREGPKDESKSPRIKVNRFVDTAATLDYCQDCKTKVYPLEKISVHGVIYHKTCFKCMECNAILRMDSYSYNQGLLYCTPHFKRLFITKGNYDTAFGLEQHKEKWNTTVA